jgi:hypothetical protein
LQIHNNNNNNNKKPTQITAEQWFILGEVIEDLILSSSYLAVT